MRIARIALTMGAVATFTAVGIQAAAADEGPDTGAPTQAAEGSGTDIMPVGVPQPVSPQAQSKLAAISAAGDASRGGDLDQARALDEAYAQEFAPDTLPEVRSLAASQAASASKSLAVEHAAQHNGYYCGPTAGYMILKFRHGAGYKSRYDGSAPGQDGLANAHHMNTAAKKRTDWADDDFSRGLNRWEKSDDWVRVPQPTVQILKDSLVYSIGTHNKPFGVNAVEFKGGKHYNGHPNHTIGHWLVAKGYASNGASGTYNDPATSVFPDAKPSFTASTQWFQQFASTNGLSL